jgi:hypothetical protein
MALPHIRQVAVDPVELADMLHLADAVLDELEAREIDFPAASGLRGAVAQVRLTAQELV